MSKAEIQLFIFYFLEIFGTAGAGAAGPLATPLLTIRILLIDLIYNLVIYLPLT